MPSQIIEVKPHEDFYPWDETPDGLRGFIIQDIAEKLKTRNFSKLLQMFDLGKPYIIVDKKMTYYRIEGKAFEIILNNYSHELKR